MAHEQQGSAKAAPEAQGDAAERAQPTGPINWSPIPDVGAGEKVVGTQPVAAYLS